MSAEQPTTTDELQQHVAVLTERMATLAEDTRALRRGVDALKLLGKGPREVALR